MAQMWTLLQPVVPLKIAPWCHNTKASRSICYSPWMEYRCFSSQGYFTKHFVSLLSMMTKLLSWLTQITKCAQQHNKPASSFMKKVGFSTITSQCFPWFGLNGNDEKSSTSFNLQKCTMASVNKIIWEWNHYFTLSSRLL